MIKPARDSTIALILFLASLAWFAFGLWRIIRFGADDVPGGVGIAVGGLVAFICVGMLLNFLWALRIMRRMQRGDGVVGRWTVPAGTVDAYRTVEAALPRTERSLWRPKAGVAAEVIFAADGVLAGGAYHGLASTGIQRMAGIRAVPGNPICLQFESRLTSLKSSGSLITSQSAIRLPIARGAEEEAARVLHHFGQVLAGEVLVNPDFWSKRVRIGLWAMIVAAFLGGAGWLMAEQSGWRADDNLGIASMVMMIAGPILGFGGLIIALIAASFHKRQRGLK